MRDQDNVFEALRHSRCRQRWRPGPRERGVLARRGRPLMQWPAQE